MVGLSNRLGYMPSTRCVSAVCLGDPELDLVWQVPENAPRTSIFHRGAEQFSPPFNRLPALVAELGREGANQMKLVVDEVFRAVHTEREGGAPDLFEVSSDGFAHLGVDVVPIDSLERARLAVLRWLAKATALVANADVRSRGACG